jgi:DNA invertase Pin-like site-specific DNA recombinase
MEAGIEFEACDFPQANRLTIHILAAVAEHEAKMISERTRAALAAAKARGTVLGGFRGRAGTCTDLAKARAVRAPRGGNWSAAQVRAVLGRRQQAQARTVEVKSIA